MTTTIVQWGTPEPSGGHYCFNITVGVANNARFIPTGIVKPSGYIFSAWCFETRFHANPTTGSAIDLYHTPLLGETLTSHGSGIDPPANTYVGSFGVYPTSNSGQILPLMNIVNTPFDFLPVIKNRTGQTIPANSGTLKCWFYNEKLTN